MSACVRVIAPAKVNLHLGVGPVRDDGYHALRSVFHALELHDTVRLAPSDALRVECDALPGLPAEHNLAYRAAVALGERCGRDPLVTIALEKRLPHGAGLGGGSSDAAAVIAGLATMWEVDPLDERCRAAARSVGADVAFFLEPSGAALMGGRGDVLERELAGMSAPVVVVRPPIPVPTPAAYAAFDATPVAAADPDAVLAALAARDPNALGAALVNNLVQASVSVVPEVGDALAWVQAHGGVVGATVAGSGSAVFALTDSDESAVRIAESAPERGWWGAATRLRPRGVEVFEDGGCE